METPASYSYHGLPSTPRAIPVSSSPSCSTCLDAPAGALADAAPNPPHAAEPTEARWTAVASMALGVFGLVTAEFLPASLLTAMASDLRVSDGAAGQAVTVRRWWPPWPRHRCRCSRAASTAGW